MPHVDAEKYYLRLLRTHTRAPTSFDDLVIVNSKPYTSFRDAAYKRGLMHLESDIELY